MMNYADTTRVYWLLCLERVNRLFFLPAVSLKVKSEGETACGHTSMTQMRLLVNNVLVIPGHIRQPIPCNSPVSEHQFSSSQT
jgi:hypothetical protein